MSSEFICEGTCEDTPIPIEVYYTFRPGRSFNGTILCQTCWEAASRPKYYQRASEFYLVPQKVYPNQEKDTSMLVDEIMDKIAVMDVWPPIFRVYISASDHTAGFNASVTFRRGDGEAGPSNLSAHGESTLEALESLAQMLSENFGRCPTCGGIPTK